MGEFLINMGEFLTQHPPPVVVLDSSKPQNSEAPRVDTYVASLKRDTKFGQPSKGKEIAGSLEVEGARSNQYTLRASHLLLSSVQSAQTPLGIGCDEIPSGTYQNLRQTYNPLFERQASRGKAKSHYLFGLTNRMSRGINLTP